jgi:hypothetical protein|tara:strand:- start:265 stop:423 length:159 start_codon:yes stop_codon:yes gene_type:complete
MKVGDLVRDNKKQIGIIIEDAGADDHEPDQHWYLVFFPEGTTWYFEGVLEAA